MVNVTFTLRHDGSEMLVEIYRDFQVPIVPREGEAVFLGTDETDDYLYVEHVWHYPNKGMVVVEFDCELWNLREAWNSCEGWKIIEGSEKKFLHYLEHPEKFEKE